MFPVSWPRSESFNVFLFEEESESFTFVDSSQPTKSNTIIATIEKYFMLKKKDFEHKGMDNLVFSNVIAQRGTQAENKNPCAFF